MLNFEIDAEQIEAIIEEFGASRIQLHQAFNRAMNRTAGTLRVMASKGLRNELQLRTVSEIRHRLKTIKLKRSGGDIILWFGANNMRISAFKGRPVKTKTGASFRGQDFEGGFLGKNSRGKLTIFKRVGADKYPIAEQTMPVADKINVFVEDEIFVNLEEIFFKNFRAEVRARTIYGVGRQ